MYSRTYAKHLNRLSRTLAFCQLDGFSTCSDDASKSTAPRMVGKERHSTDRPNWPTLPPLNQQIRLPAQIRTTIFILSSQNLRMNVQCSLSLFQYELLANSQNRSIRHPPFLQFRDMSSCPHFDQHRHRISSLKDPISRIQGQDLGHSKRARAILDKHNLPRHRTP